MTVTVKNNAPLVVPASIQRRAGLSVGDQLEFRARRGVITITPKSSAPEKDYALEQRRAIDAQLNQAERGPQHGPFETADEMIANMKAQLKKRAAAKKPKRAR